MSEDLQKKLDAAQAEIARLTDKVEGLTSELENAVGVAHDRGAFVWAKLNYPKIYERLCRNAPLPVAKGDLEMKMCRWVGLNGAKPSAVDLADYILHELDNREDMDAVFSAVLREATSLLRQPEATPEGLIRNAALQEAAAHLRDMGYWTQGAAVLSLCTDASAPTPASAQSDSAGARIVLDAILAGKSLASLDDPLADLVARFSRALLEKLRAAEKKYGYNNGWLNNDWADDLRRDIRTHIDKGDPRDVAAYCAFAWHHGWPLSSDSVDEVRAARASMGNPASPPEAPRDLANSISDAIHAALIRGLDADAVTTITVCVACDYANNAYGLDYLDALKEAIDRKKRELAGRAALKSGGE